MKPGVAQPSLEQLRSIVGLMQAPQWKTFFEWLEEAYESAWKQTMTCEDRDLRAARASAAALWNIIDLIEGAPERIRALE